MVANYLAESLNYGPTAPFAVAIPCFALCFLIVALTWTENYGNQQTLLWQSYKEGASLIWQHRPILWIGMVQSIIESCMYIFVFLWTPVMLVPTNQGPLGMIFSCFMVCIMIGSSLFSTLLAKEWTPGHTLQTAATILAFCMAICTVSAHPQASVFQRNISFAAFLALETAIGLYFPSIGVLRSQFHFQTPMLHCCRSKRLQVSKYGKLSATTQNSRWRRNSSQIGSTKGDKTKFSPMPLRKQEPKISKLFPI